MRENRLTGQNRPLGPGLDHRGARESASRDKLPGEVLIPALGGFPASARVFLLQDPARYAPAVSTLCEVLGAIDFPVFAGAERGSVTTPVTAMALHIAAEQARVLRTPLGQPVLSASPVKPEELERLIGCHDHLSAGAEITSWILDGARRGQMVAGAARAALFSHAIAWYRAEVAAVRPNSERGIDLRSTFSPVTVEIENRKARAAEAERKAEQKREDARERLSEAQADLTLAQVLRDLRQGRPVDPETRLQAARHLRKRLRQGAV